MTNDLTRDLELETLCCPLCGSAGGDKIVETTDYLTNCTISFTVIKCRNCGLCYTCPRPKFDDLLRYFYKDNYICYDKPGLLTRLRERSKHESRRRDLDKFVPDNGRFLDVGCATGEFLGYLKESTAWEVHGCEPNAEIAARCASRGIPVKACTLDKAGYPDNFFDVVTMSHVLEHVPDHMSTLREIFRILKPGGVLLSEQPNIETPMRNLFGKNWWGYHLPRHLVHFDWNTLRQSVESVGLVVQTIHSCVRPGLTPWSIHITLLRAGFPPWLARIFSHHNPFFVILFFPLEWFLARFSQSDAMEVIAIKPN